ncbi:unnamed protein product [Sphagnum balticum]
MCNNNDCQKRAVGFVETRPPIQYTGVAPIQYTTPVIQNSSLAPIQYTTPTTLTYQNPVAVAGPIQYQNPPILQSSAPTAVTGAVNTVSAQQYFQPATATVQVPNQQYFQPATAVFQVPNQQYAQPTTTIVETAKPVNLTAAAPVAETIVTPTAVVQEVKNGGCIFVPGLNSQVNLATPVVTDFRPNQSIPFTDWSGNSASRNDKIMQSNCGITGWYLPDANTYELGDNFIAEPGLHTFMKMGKLTALWGNIVLRYRQTPNERGVTRFTIDVPIPGTSPVSLSGTVNATVFTMVDARNGTEDLVDVLPAIVDLIRDNSNTDEGTIRIIVSGRGMVIGAGNRIDISFSLSYVSV